MRLTDCLNNFSTPLGVLSGIARKRSLECLQICVASAKQPNSKAMKEVAAVLCGIDDIRAKEFSKSLSRDDASADCFEIVQGKVLIGLVDQTVEDIASVSDCQKLCAASKQDNDILCKSAMYYAKDKECIIASENRETQPALFIDDKNAVYIENKCAGGTRRGDSDRLRPASGREVQARPPSTQVSEPAPQPQNTGAPPPDRLTLPPILSPPPNGNLEEGSRQSSDSYVTVPPKATYAQPEKPSYAKLAEVDHAEPKPEEGYAAGPSRKEPVDAAAVSATEATAMNPSVAATTEPSTIGPGSNEKKGYGVEKTTLAAYIGTKPTTIASALGASATKVKPEPEPEDSPGIEKTTLVASVGAASTTSAGALASSGSSSAPIDAAVVDSYGVDQQKEKITNFVFRFNDEVEEKCFSEVYPPRIMADRVKRAPSLQHCVSQCRRCINCLPFGSKCAVVGYSIERRLCAMGREQSLRQMDRSRSMGNYAFFLRGNC